MAELVVEVALEVAFDLLVEAVDNTENILCMFNNILADLKRSVDRLKPTIDEIIRLKPKPENSSIEEIRDVILKAEQIVRQCSDIAWWKFWKRYVYVKRIEKLDSSLRRLIDIDLQLDQMKAILEISAQVEELQRSVSKAMRQRKSGGTIFGRSRTRVLRVASRVKRSVISMQSWVIVCLISFFRIRNWGYQKLKGSFWSS